MSNDPRSRSPDGLPSFEYDSDDVGRDTRLDPIDAAPDATQPGSALTGPAATKLITPHHHPNVLGGGASSPQGGPPTGPPLAQLHAQSVPPPRPRLPTGEEA